MRRAPVELATLDEVEPFLRRLRAALAEVGVVRPEPVPDPDAPKPPPHWQEREPGED